ncbi:hypothetical protein DV737_g3264, partial [Chaetothyriales sp. CBS 132003]
MANTTPNADVKKLRICIIGAGMGGLTCALALAKSGFENIEVYESASNLGFVGAGIQLAPNMTRILDRLGVWQGIEKEAVVLNETSIRSGDSDTELGHVNLQYIKQAYGYPHMVGHRSSLANGIYQGCRKETNITFYFSTTVQQIKSFGPNPTFTASPRDGRPSYDVEADILLAADGIKSSTRVEMLKRLGATDAEVKDTGQAAYRIMIDRKLMQTDPELLSLIDADCATRWIGEKRHIIAYPVASKQIYNLSTVQPDDNFAAAPSATYTTKGSKPAMLRVFSDFCPKVQRMLKLVPEAPTSEFRAYLLDLNCERFLNARDQDPYSYADAFKTKQQPPWLYDLSKTWESLLDEPFHGLTTNGNILPGLFKLQDEEVPIQEIVLATQNMLDQLSSEQRDSLLYPVNAREWRAWSNPEFLLRPFGLRLEELREPVIALILSVIEKSFSAQGYQKALTAMRINHFLGELCQLPKILNQYSYNFLIFGTPSTSSPWGWSLYGHHLCLNTFFIGSQIIISPTFTGAEPNLIDSGPWSGSQILRLEGDLGLQLMTSLPGAAQKQAQIFTEMLDPGMNVCGNLKTDRWNRDDQRHLCGAFRDNRIVPYEGLCVSSFNSSQKEILLKIIDEFVLYLPDRARQKRLEQVQAHFDETYVCWIGGYGERDAFYYRIQSPVIVCEFDHHSGVFLTNKEPAKFHTHTIVRTPNGGDYGNVLRDEKDRLE